MQSDGPSTAPIHHVATAVGLLAYADEGHGPATVVTVPGLPGGVRDFRWLAPRLAEHARVVRVDLPGYGSAPRATRGGMDTAQRAEAVAALCTALDLDDVTLVAHSSGAPAAVLLAGREPALVSDVVLLAPTGPRPHYPQPWFRALAAGGRVPGGRLLIDPALGRLFTASGFPASLPATERRYAIADAAALNFAQYQASLRAVDGSPLVCWAADDPIIPDAITTDLVATLPSAQTLRFAQGGHNVQKTQAAAVADAVLARAVQA